MSARVCALSCRDVVKERGMMMIKGWLTFLEITAPYVLRDGLLPEPLAEMWKNLRAGLLHYFRTAGDDFTVEARRKAKLALLKYSILAEQVNLTSSAGQPLVTYVAGCARVQGRPLVRGFRLVLTMCFEPIQPAI